MTRAYFHTFAPSHKFLNQRKCKHYLGALKITPYGHTGGWSHPKDDTGLCGGGGLAKDNR